MSQIESLLEVDGLVIQRDGRRILQIKHLAIPDGKVLAVLGPNGAGKSTLILALSRLLELEQGEIRFHGKAVDSQGELAFRRQIGLVLQDPLLISATVFENVATPLRFRHFSRREVARRVDEWLGYLGILHLRQRHAHSLSGGEAQRVSLARAFAIQPQLLLLDEPFSGLDAPTRDRLLLDLHSLLGQAQLTAVFVTHDLDEALLLADRVAILLAGQIRQIGPPDQVFSSPIDSDVAAFVGVETVVPTQVIASREGRLLLDANGVTLEAVGDLPLAHSALLCLRPEDVTLWMGLPSSPASSARNRLTGEIARLTPRGPLVRVVIDCGFPLVSLITRTSAQEMGLAEGKRVTATFKASAVHLIAR